MTVIAWDGKTMAGDRQRNFYNTPVRAKKVWRVRGTDGLLRLVGAAGESSDCVAFVRWLQGGEKPSATDMDALVIDHKNQAWFCTHKLVYCRILEPFFAIGCGADYALAAMACGKTAAQAVKIAARFDNRIGVGVDVVRLR